MKPIIVGVLLGAIPGVVMVLLTIPISGEAELTLGVYGIIVAVVGAIIGAIIGLRKRRL